MSKQVSPFAALTGAEKQIRWLEYQSIRLPYVEARLEDEAPAQAAAVAEEAKPVEKATPSPSRPFAAERPQPPPEVPRTLPPDYQKTRHSQYDAVIARLKQAELQSRRFASQAAQQGK